MYTVTVNTHRPYSIHIGESLLRSALLIESCAGLASEWVIITDNNVKALYAEHLRQCFHGHFKVHLISIPPGEHTKSREMKAAIEDQMHGLGCGRDIGISALGGGVITDLAGFIAATYCRGVPAVYIPTTLLAMVDATVGGKTAVNTPHGKNLIGAFAQPRAVFADIGVLVSLDQMNFVNGIVESIKHALIADADFFEFIDYHADAILRQDTIIVKKLIIRSIEIKKHIIEVDEFDTGKRALCNFGHTIAHALESHFDYSLSHGIAVALGMMVEGFLSMGHAGLSNDEYVKIKNILMKFGISKHIIEKHKVDYSALKNLLQSDKKSVGLEPHFVLLNAIGSSYIPVGGYTSTVAHSYIAEALCSI